MSIIISDSRIMLADEGWWQDGVCTNNGCKMDLREKDDIMRGVIGYVGTERDRSFFMREKWRLTGDEYKRAVEHVEDNSCALLLPETHELQLIDNKGSSIVWSDFEIIGMHREMLKGFFYERLRLGKPTYVRDVISFVEFIGYNKVGWRVFAFDADIYAKEGDKETVPVLGHGRFFNGRTLEGNFKFHIKGCISGELDDEDEPLLGEAFPSIEKEEARQNC